MQTRNKVFLATFFGAWVGAFVALNMRQECWWVGMIVGGLVGYTAYDFKRMITAVPEAFRAARKECSGLGTTIAQDLGQGIHAIWSWTLQPRPFNYTAMLLGVTTVVSILFHFVGAPGQWRGPNGQHFTAGDYRVAAFLLLIVTVMVSLLWGLLLLSLSRAGGGRERKLGDVEENYINAYREIGRGILNVTRFIAWGMWARGVKFFLAVVLFAALFVARLFELVHSDIRLLVLTYAAIGTSVGYFTGSPNNGALVGGCLGVVSYELISKRLLHLVPSNSR